MRRISATALMLTALVFVLAVSASADGWFSRRFKGEKGSGDLVTETRDVKPFTRIETRGSADITVIVGEEQTVEPLHLFGQEGVADPESAAVGVVQADHDLALILAAQVAADLAWFYADRWILDIADLVLAGQDVTSDGGKLLQIRFYPMWTTEYVPPTPTP